MGGNKLGVSSVSIASFFVDEAPSPSDVIAKAEQLRILEDPIEGMQSLDREILAPRHFELFGNAEVVKLLSVGEPATSQQFFRAIIRAIKRLMR